MRILVLCLVITMATAWPHFEAQLRAYERTVPGRYDGAIRAYLPTDRAAALDTWFTRAARVRDNLGNVPFDGIPTHTYTNDATDAQSLFKLASSYKDTFMHFLRQAANESGTRASFGPGDQYAQKTLLGLKEKINSRLLQDPLSKPWLSIGDSLRGTLIASNTATLLASISKLKAISARWYRSFDIGVDNKFARIARVDSVTGYVGIHADGWIEGRIKVEIQFHLDKIMDGTTDCPKEFTHKIYEITRRPGVPIETQLKGNTAQQFVYGFGLGLVNVSNNSNGDFRTLSPRRTAAPIDPFLFYDGVLFADRINNYQVYDRRRCQWKQVESVEDKFSLLTSATPTSRGVASGWCCGGNCDVQSTCFTPPTWDNGARLDTCTRVVPSNKWVCATGQTAPIAHFFCASKGLTSAISWKFEAASSTQYMDGTTCQGPGGCSSFSSICCGNSATAVATL